MYWTITNGDKHVCRNTSDAKWKAVDYSGYFSAYTWKYPVY